MNLCDDKARNRLDNENLPESSFQCLNDYDWPGATCIRNSCESWFKKLPIDIEVREDIRARFRAKDNQNHEGALFELFLHELFTRLGCSLEVHPEVADGQPDFLVSHGDRHFYLEATVTGQTSGPFTPNRNEQDVVDKLSKLTSAHFNIGVHMEGTLLSTLRRKRVIHPFKQLLNAHDPDEVRRLIDEGGLSAAPSRRLECGNWSLEGWLRPISHENRGGDQTRRISIEPRATFTNSLTPVRKALKGKASKYGRLDAPLIVAVNARDMFYNGRSNDMGVLFGDEQLLYSAGCVDQTPQFGRKPNGVWSCDRDSGIDVILMFQRIDIWNLPRASACLYINPWNTDVTFPDVLFRLPHGKVRDGEMKWVEGEDVAQLVGVT